VSGDTVTIERQTAGGYDEITSPTPALITVTAGIEPRYPTFKGIMQAKSKPVSVYTAADLGVTNDVGQKITEVAPVASRAAGEIVEDDGEGYAKIVELLEQVKVV
jgi:electron transfer flavoprotein beta subunit